MNTLVRPAGTDRRPRLSLWVLRVAVTVHLVLVLAQPVLAGLFLTGNVDAIEVHSAVGGLVATASLVLIAAAVAYVVRRGRLWVLPVMVVLFLAVGGQVALGATRVLGAHVPLGVAIAVASALLAVWVWSPSAARPRGGAR
ncbi:hypothetical protein [Actinophytocola sp. KF-1]